MSQVRGEKVSGRQQQLIPFEMLPNGHEFWTDWHQQKINLYLCAIES